MSKELSVHFKDGKRKIDFVLAIRSSHLRSNEKHYWKFVEFLHGVLQLGFQVELEPLEGDKDVIFIKIHAPNSVLETYAEYCDIDFAYKFKGYRPPFSTSSKLLATPLTNPDPNSDVYKRNPESVSQQKPSTIRDLERVLIVDRLLTEIKYDEGFGDFGYESLLNSGVINHAFTLHCGPYEWTDSGPLNDRQLLAKYWANFGLWYKHQPLKLIGNYFGTETAFYYAWLGYYNTMLIPASIVCIIATVYGFCTMYSPLNSLSTEICDSNLILCPRCHQHDCKYEFLNSTCRIARLTYVCDNYGTVLNAIFMSLWSTFFLEMWRRKQALLQIRWGVRRVKANLHFRPQYAKQTKHRRVSPVTGELEPYTPDNVRAFKIAISYSTVLLLLIIMILATFSVMVYRRTIPYIIISNSNDAIITSNGEMISSVSASCFSAAFITLFTLSYAKLAIKLTNMELHRTQKLFDEAYIYKSYALAFTNNYSAIFYIAFFKGKFFTHPGDMKLYNTIGGIGSDICGPTKCILDLSIQLLVVMLSKIFVNNAEEIFKPILRKQATAKLYDIDLDKKPFDTIEHDFVAYKRKRYYMITEFMELVIQYGFVTFFIAAFPLGCVLALINNIIELRLDAFNFIKSFRKPVPKNLDGIGVWAEILQHMTYMGVASNAMVIAFTSHFVPQEVYRQTVDYDLKGFLNWTLSQFAINDFKVDAQMEGYDVCYYPGIRYPPSHPEKYKLSHEFWFIFAVRMAFVLIFEHFVLALMGFLSFGIPKIPFSVQQHIKYQERLNIEMEFTEE